MPKPIESEWNDFCKACFAPSLAETHPMQYIDLRRTFYGGAKAMLSMLLTRLSPGDEITDADMQLMKDADMELREFAEMVRKGQA